MNPDSGAACGRWVRIAVVAVILSVSAPQCAEAPRYTRLSSQPSVTGDQHRSRHSKSSGQKNNASGEGVVRKTATRKKNLVNSYYQRGKASFYARKFHGRKTASGERYNQNDLTAAHRTLPFGTKVRVTNFNNGKSVVVRINDRGPWGGKKRIIDLSRAAAEAIGMVSKGIVSVGIELVE